MMNLLQVMNIFFDSRGDMVILPDCPRHTLLGGAELSAVGTSCNSQHDMEKSIDATISSSRIATISDKARSGKDITKERINSSLIQFEHKWPMLVLFWIQK